MRQFVARCRCGHKDRDHGVIRRHVDAALAAAPLSACRVCTCSRFIDERQAEREVWEAVLRRDRQCLLRGQPGWDRCVGPMTPHHLRKSGQGGPYTEANLVVLCSSHNTAVEDHPDEAKAIGLVVTQHITAKAARARRVAAGLQPNTTTRSSTDGK